MLSEIGSNFWISPVDIQGVRPLDTPCILFGYKGSDFVWMSSGRSATRMVLKTIEERNPNLQKTALLPPFTCHTVIEPFLEYGYEVHSLPLSMDLTTTADEIVQCQEETKASVVLVHRYYGFDTLPGFNKAVDVLTSKGVVVIEDCTQCLYCDFKVSNADYFVGSIRKWCGAPDGGFAVCKEGMFTGKPSNADNVMVEAKRLASEMKYQFLFEGKGDKPTFKAKYREAEALLDNQTSFYSIGKLSATIQANLNVDFLRCRRRINYQVLLDGLKETNAYRIVFQHLPEGVIPLYFPLLVENREQLQDVLAGNDIYAPVVWPKPDCCPAIGEMAETIYNQILCIPIDQRYREDDMKRIVNVINKNYEK